MRAYIVTFMFHSDAEQEEVEYWANEKKQELIEDPRGPEYRAIGSNEDEPPVKIVENVSVVVEEIRRWGSG